MISIHISSMKDGQYFFSSVILSRPLSSAYMRGYYLGFYEKRLGSEYLSEKATHYDRELAGIAQAMEEVWEVNMLAILIYSKPGISTLRNLDRELTLPRSKIEARELKELCRIFDKDTCMARIKAHKEVKGNKEAGMLCKEASILGHKSEEVVTPNGLRAWAKWKIAEARGGVREGILEWHHQAISTYTWCITEKKLQRRWHYRIGKEKALRSTVTSNLQEQPGTRRHIVEECLELTALRREIEEQR